MVHAQTDALLDAWPTMVVRDPAMADLMRQVALVASSTANVMITGESGTGKELVAAHLHRDSGRGTQGFAVLTCTALPEALLEQALFGDAAGTPAGGTLLLDEVGEMDLSMQAKVLRAVQLHERERLGGGSPVRIVAATSRNLQEDVRQGRFRADLFFRLNEITLKVPPLRERPTEIPVLATHFAQSSAHAHDLPAGGVSPEAVALLLQHSWPGNVRELKNAIYRAVLTESGSCLTPRSIDIDLVPPRPFVAGASQHLLTVHTSGRTIEAVEKDMILDTLCQCKGNRNQTAVVLGISIRTLRNKLHEYERDGTRIPRPVVVAVG